MRCDLCHRETPSVPAPFGELQLCESCARGNIEHSLRPLGAHIESEQVLVVRSLSETVPEFRVRAYVPGLREREASMVRRGLAGRVAGIFLPGARTGDAVFDDNVRARSKDMRWLGRLLESDAVQTAVIEAALRDEGEIRIREQRIFATCVGELDVAEMGDMKRAVGVIARGMAMLEDAWPTLR